MLRNDVAEDCARVLLDRSAVAKARAGRESLKDPVRQAVPIGGVTPCDDGAVAQTGTDAESEVQADLIRSHSTGIGPLFPEDEARVIVVAQLCSLAKGYSAVRPVVLERLAGHLNHRLAPAVPEVGSLGAGGDTTPLAHVASTLIGEGHSGGTGGVRRRPVPGSDAGSGPLDGRGHRTDGRRPGTGEVLRAVGRYSGLVLR